MKKIMLFAAVAATILSSCSKNETVERSDVNAIGFETYVGKNTKGVPVSGIKFADGATMKVWGYYTTAAMGADLTGATVIPNLGGATVTKETDNKWNYSPLAYWKDGSFHNFFAVAPAVATGVAYAGGKVTYTVQDKISEQVDFMVADPNKATTAWDGKAAVAKQVFTFHHILSQIKYSAKIVTDSEKATNVKVKSVKIESMSATDDNVATTLATTGEVNIIGKSGNTAYAYTGVPTGTVAAYTLTPTAAIALDAALTTPNYVAVNHADNDILMVMPQTTQGKLRFTLVFEYTDTALQQQVAEGTFLTNAPQTWEVNKIYHYKFDVNMPQVLNQKPVEFGEPTISDWDATENEVKPIQ